jgi:hypothetical protein
LTFDGCRKITVKGNTVEGDVLGNTIQLINTAKNEFKLGKDSFFKNTKVSRINSNGDK